MTEVTLAGGRFLQFGAKEALLLPRNGHAWPVEQLESFLSGLSVTLVESSNQLEQALAELRAAAPRLLSLDVETLGPGVSDAVSLIQLGVDEPGRLPPHQYVLDCLAFDPDALGPLLEEQTLGKLVHSAEFERERLLYRFGWRVAPVIDTRREMETIQRHLVSLDPEGRARFVNWQPREGFRPERTFFDNKLGTLAQVLLGIELDKTDQASDWSRRPLTRDQLLYAAADAAVLYPLVRAERRLGRRLGIEPTLLAVHHAFDRTTLALAERRQRFGSLPDDRLTAEELLATAPTRALLARHWEACRSARLPHMERLRLRALARARWHELPV